jgi:hypothetical protein
MASKYQPLHQHLMGVASDRIRLSFEEIERVLRFSLPNSARQYAPWWANTGGSHIQADAWMSAGWRTAQVDVPGEQVTFERIAMRPSPAAPEAPQPSAQAGVEDSSAPFARDDMIVINKVTLRGGAIRMLEDYCEAHGGDLAGAATSLLNEIALERRRQLLDWVRANAPKVPGDSTDLIREDRDAR